MAPLTRSRRTKLLAAVAGAVAAGLFVVMWLAPSEQGSEQGRSVAPSSAAQSLKERAAELQAAAAASDPATAKEHTRAFRIADRLLGHRDSSWRVLAALGPGTYLIENDAGYCFEIRTAYWPESPPAAAKPAGRFAALQTLGIGC
jgi:hypothetical protein